MIIEEEKSILVKCRDCNHLMVDVDSGCFYCNKLSPDGSTRLSVPLHLAHSCCKFTSRESIKIKNTSNRCCICKYFRANTGMCHNLENARLIGNEIVLGAFLKGHNQVTDVTLKGNYCCDYFEEYELPF